MNEISHRFHLAVSLWWEARRSISLWRRFITLCLERREA